MYVDMSHHLQYAQCATTHNMKASAPPSNPICCPVCCAIFVVSEADAADIERQLQNRHHSDSGSPVTVDQHIEKPRMSCRSLGRRAARRQICTA